MTFLKTASATTSSFRQFDRCTRDRFLTLDRDSGAVSLTRRIAVTDEVGRCNRRDREVVTDRIWAKKEFYIEDGRVFGATLALRVGCEVAEAAQREDDVFHCADPRKATLLIEVNGDTFRFEWPKRWTYWEECAFPVPIPTESLRSGVNEFIFHSADSTEWYFLIEESLWPNRSARSMDSGRSWDYEHLGINGGHDGEYLLRLQLEGYPSRGALTSPAIDLAVLASGTRIGEPFVPREIAVESEGETPEGTDIEWQLRGGSTPSYEPHKWTPWHEQTDLSALLDAQPRFVQWRAILTTNTPKLTPRLREVTLSASVEPQGESSSHDIRVVSDGAPPIECGSYPFAYQSYGEERLHIARQRWRLDEVIEDAENELEELMCLADWTRRQWDDGWNDGGMLKYCPPWDGLVIRELAKRGLSLGMCTHYSTLFIQACLALGFVARHNIIQGHCVAEVWVNHCQKWVMFDPGCDTDDQRRGTYHLERGGVPLSTLEIHRIWLKQNFDGVKMVPDLQGPRFALDSWLKHFKRFSITLREDDLTSLSPGEPEHGWTAYHFDRYLWWEDDKTPKLEWFTLSTGRVADMYWDINRVEIHLMETGNSGVVRVTLDTVTPNLAGFQVRRDGDSWEDSTKEFTWEFYPGENRLDARSVNRFGRCGPVASLRVERVR